NKDAINQMAVPPVPSQSSFLSNENLAAAPVSTDKPQPPETLPLSKSSLESLTKERSSEAGPTSPELPEPTERSLQEGESASKKLKSSERGVEAVSENPSRPALEKTPSLPRTFRDSSKLPAGPVDVTAPITSAPPSSTSPDFEYCSKDPATCPIVPGQETVIEISKGRSGLGLSIVGGKDTQLVLYIVVCSGAY
ncbi:hypothetical protein NFI96_029285, partial [Prochilodus magdalenae]